MYAIYDAETGLPITDRCPYTDNPWWVAKRPDGVWDHVTQAEANGITVGDTLYHLRGTPEIEPEEGRTFPTVYVRRIDGGTPLHDQAMDLEDAQLAVCEQAADTAQQLDDISIAICEQATDAAAELLLLSERVQRLEEQVQAIVGGGSV